MSKRLPFAGTSITCSVQSQIAKDHQNEASSKGCCFGACCFELPVWRACWSFSHSRKNVVVRGGVGFLEKESGRSCKVHAMCFMSSAGLQVKIPAAGSQVSHSRATFPFWVFSSEDQRQYA